jgi:quinoprotein glucose dehydrogenase
VTSPVRQELLDAAAFPRCRSCLCAAARPSRRCPEESPGPGSPDESLAAVQVDKGLSVEVWAAEPLLRNPVAFCFDEKGAAYVAETNRVNAGVPDTRGFMKWLDEDLACRSIADRLAMYKKHGYRGFEKNEDLVRRIWDSTGSGKADKSSVFSSGYNRPQDGLGAGVLARRGKVYYTCIPDLYVLEDTNGDNKADKKTSLFTGFGLAVQFVGHDLHGLRMGPDGKLYFSIGDRGFNVKTKEGKQLTYPNEGAVLRCDPDGSNLEVVHHGLRNPQELAFDDYGNLFTYDNNCDSGDRARWVYIVEGGDSGWRGGYQYGTLYHPPGVPQGNRGPWNAENIWHTQTATDGPPAYVVPPLAHLGNGPSGISHYPGIGLNDKYQNHFFASDFTASPGNSVIWDVSMKPKGASFELDPPRPFVRGIVPTDCEFGPDGAFYWSDWVAGWGHPNKGRIFRLTDPEAIKNPAVAEAKKLLAEGMEKRSVEELAKLLEHPHQQVRQEAQYEFASGNLPGDVCIAALEKVAKESKNRVARLHAIWSLGMPQTSMWSGISSQRSNFNNYDFIRLAFLTNDPDAEMRVQLFKAISRAGIVAKRMEKFLLKGLSDSEPRVQFFAALAFGRMLQTLSDPIPDSNLPRYEPLLELLESNNDKDAYLRHAGVVGLAKSAKNPVDLFNAWTLAKDKYNTSAVRLGVLLALRRHKSEKCAEFLADSDPKIVAEAAMAIHDERIEGALPKLAALAEKIGQANPIIYRAIAANYEHGGRENAKRVSRTAARTDFPDHVRVFAMKLLADWANPPRRDPITGLIHDLPKRDANVATEAIKPVITGIFSGSDAVRSEAAKLAATLGIKEVGPLLIKILKDASAPASSRADALFALAAVKDPTLGQVTAFALASDQPKLRAAGLSLKAKSDPNGALKNIAALLRDDKASTIEKQAAFSILGQFKESAEADRLVRDWLAAAGNGMAPNELLLDIVEAAQLRAKPTVSTMRAELKKGLEQFEASRDPAKDKLAPWSESLAGGDADKGRAIFLNNSAVYCQRCHKLDGQGGDVGPPLNGIAAQMGKDRRYLLESIVLPSTQIAKGYESAVLTLTDGRVVSGVVKEDTKKQVKIVTAEAKEMVIGIEDIESRRTGPSAMPDDLPKKLSRRELRDLVEFLISLKEPRKHEEKR